MTSELLLVVGAIFLLGVGCSSGDGETAPGGGVRPNMTAYCAALCDQLNECDNSEDASICANGCENETAAVAPKLRADWIAKQQACVLAKDCASVISGDAYSSCADEVNAGLAPSAAGTSFCDAWEAAATRCSEQLDKANCLDASKQYNDAALREAQGCLDKSCSLIVLCVGAALGESVGRGGGSNSCPYAFDGLCDEPSVCPPGTDTADCSGTGSCPTTFNGVCDEPDLCPPGTDSVDCSGNQCPYAFNGVCDEPDFCPSGTDSADCRI